MRCNYYLRSPSKKQGRSSIYLSVSYRGQRCILFPGESVDVKNWINDKVRKINKPKPVTENNALIGRLNRFEQLVRDTHDDLQKTLNGVVSEELLTRTVNEKIRPTELTVQKPERILITDFIQTMIDDSQPGGSRKTVDDMEYNPNSLKPYTTTINHFNKFQETKKKKYFLTDITQTLINEFTNYLNSFLALNASAKYLTTFKTMMTYATEKKLIGVNVSLEIKVRVRKAKADNIFLTEQEIRAIMELKEFKTPLYEVVRDIFVVGCCTGLRFQDYSMIDLKDVRDGFLEFDPEKMKKKYQITTKVIIPVLPMFKEIIAKYPNGFPQSPCNQVFNDYLKEIGELVPSLNIDYKKKMIRAHKIEYVPLKKYDMLVTHTARRSFCTNMYLRGIPVETIMAISGHTTAENFMKYIKADRRMHAELLKKKYEEGEKRDL